MRHGRRGQVPAAPIPRGGDGYTPTNTGHGDEQTTRGQGRAPMGAHGSTLAPRGIIASLCWGRAVAAKNGRAATDARRRAPRPPRAAQTQHRATTDPRAAAGRVWGSATSAAIAIKDGAVAGAPRRAHPAARRQRAYRLGRSADPLSVARVGRAGVEHGHAATTAPQRGGAGAATRYGVVRRSGANILMRSPSLLLDIGTVFRLCPREYASPENNDPRWGAVQYDCEAIPNGSRFNRCRQ